MAGQIQTILKMNAAVGLFNWVTADVRMTASSAAALPSQDGSHYLNEITNELVGHRLALAGRTVTEDIVNKRAQLNANCPTWVAVNAGTIATLWVYIFNANDALALVLAILDPGDLIENGSDVLCEFDGQLVNGLVLAL